MFKFVVKKWLLDPGPSLLHLPYYAVVKARLLFVDKKSCIT